MAQDRRARASATLAALLGLPLAIALPAAAGGHDASEPPLPRAHLADLGESAPRQRPVALVVPSPGLALTALLPLVEALEGAGLDAWVLAFPPPARSFQPPRTLVPSLFGSRSDPSVRGAGGASVCLRWLRAIIFSAAAWESRRVTIADFAAAPTVISSRGSTASRSIASTTSLGSCTGGGGTGSWSL